MLPLLSPGTVLLCFFAVQFYVLPLRQSFWSLCLQHKISIEFACGYFDLGRRSGATVSTVTSQQGEIKGWGFAKKNKSVHLNFQKVSKSNAFFFFKYMALEISGHQKVFFFFLSFIEQTQTERCLRNDWP